MGSSALPHPVPRTLEEVVELAQAYAEGKAPKRAEVTGFMKALLEILAAPVVVKVAPDVDQAATVPVQQGHAPILVEPTPPELDKLVNQFAQLQRSGCVIEPRIAGGTAVYLPPEANQRYTPREVRVLAARMLTLAHQIETGTGARA